MTVGNYLIVDDTALQGGSPVTSGEPGPAAALGEFLRENSSFEIDKSRERFMFTASPDGFLKRVR